MIFWRVFWYGLWIVILVLALAYGRALNKRVINPAIDNAAQRVSYPQDEAVRRGLLRHKTSER
jgi:hypothetical protein